MNDDNQTRESIIVHLNDAIDSISDLRSSDMIPEMSQRSIYEDIETDLLAIRDLMESD